MKNKILFLIIFMLLAVFNRYSMSANKITVAVAPFKNSTGYNKYDYLSDLIYNILLSNIKDFELLNIYERQRPDLIINERAVSINRKISAAPADLLINGAYFTDKSTDILKINFHIIDFSGNREKKIEKTINYSNVKLLISDIQKIINGFADEYKFIRSTKTDVEIDKKISGRQIGVTGFNNYSDLKIYDSLQKGIIYFIEEKLNANPELKILERDNCKEIAREQLLRKSLNTNNTHTKFEAADLLIAGCYTFYDDIFRLDCRIIDAHTTEILNIFTVESDIKNITVSLKNIIDGIYLFLSGAEKRAELENNICPENPEALIYYSQGVEAYDKGEYLQAIEFIKRAVSIEPYYTYAKWQAAKIYEKNLFQYDKAVEAYKQVLTDTMNKQNYEKALLNLAMIYYNHLKNYKSAIKYFSEFSVKFPESVYSDAVSYSLGHSHQLLNNYKSAFECYLKFIKSDNFSPLLGNFYFRAGQCCYFLEDYKNAKYFLQKAVDDYGAEIFKSESEMKNILIRDEAAKYLAKLNGRNSKN